MLSSDQPFAPNDKSAPAARPPLVPGHRLLRQIAHGSYGEIWLARTELGAYRAVKIIRRANFSNPKPFDREFAGIQRYEPVSREHEGLVDVLQVGRDEAAGYFYYVMELADDASRAPLNTNSTGSAGIRAGEFSNPGPRQPAGKDASAPGSCAPAQAPPAHSPNFSPAGYAPLTLAHAILARTRLPASEVVTLGISLARALEFLHSRRLVHRDIKPSNIIFVGGQPKLADVGLIADLGGPLTFVGTEGYFPPEGPGTAQADIYSLGKVLYEAATGKDRQEFPDLPTNLNVLPGVPPAEPTERFKNGTAGGTHGSTLPAAGPPCAIPEIEEPSTPLGETQVDAALLELNEVLLKACESNPRARYATAAAMAADLERIKAGQSLRNRRARQWRLRSIVITTALLAGLVVVGVGLVAMVEYERSKPRLLFRDDFDGPQLDTNLWVYSHRSDGPSNEGQRSFQVSQSGGELLVEAETIHATSGVTSSLSGWLDFRPDLRVEAPCQLDLELHAKSEGGHLILAVSDGATPALDSSPAGLKVFEWDAMTERGPQQWPTAQIRIKFYSRPEVAIVYPDKDRPDEFEVMDLHSLPQWHLRLHSYTATSEGFLKGTIAFRIRDIVVSSIPDDEVIVGRVVEDPSELPLQDVIVLGDSEQVLGKTLDNGAFVLRRSHRTNKLTVQRNGYRSLTIEGESEADRLPFLEVRLRKLEFKVGDMVDTIPIGEIRAHSLGFHQDTLVVLAEDTETSNLLLPVDVAAKKLASAEAGSPKLDFGQWGPISEFATCGDRMVGLRRYYGALFDLDPTPPQLLLELSYPRDGGKLNYVCGVAFDGELLWFFENDPINRRCALHRFDLNRRELLNPIPCADQAVTGLAWDGKQFWVSNKDGRLYCVNREKALRLGSLEMGRSSDYFPGNYDRLAIGQGHLWGLDWQKRRVCKIKIWD